MVRTLIANTAMSEELNQEIAYEVERIVAGLTQGSSCLLTGSIVEGLGNEHSDIDVYVVHEENAGGNAIAVGMRKSRYIDCEYMTLGSLDKLATRIADCTPNALVDMPMSVLDRYYRVSIAVRASVAPAAEPVFERFDRTVACAVFSDWCALTAFQLGCGSVRVVSSG